MVIPASSKASPVTILEGDAPDFPAIEEVIIAITNTTVPAAEVAVIIAVTVTTAAVALETRVVVSLKMAIPLYPD